MSNRTTHSDLAQLLVDHVERLRRVPAGYLVSNEATLKTIADASRILVEQDRRIEEFTIAARESTDPSIRKFLARK